MVRAQPTHSLDPVTFEVLKNSFETIVDEMAEQVLRTCHSFVMYARDFSSALCDGNGDTIMQGRQDIAVHVGTLHFTAKAVLEAFPDDMQPGDVFAINDPYLGGTHFCNVRIVRPIFVDDELIAIAQSTGTGRTLAEAFLARSTSTLKITSGRVCVFRPFACGRPGGTALTWST